MLDPPDKTLDLRMKKTHLDLTERKLAGCKESKQTTTVQSFYNIPGYNTDWTNNFLCHFPHTDARSVDVSYKQKYVHN